MESVFHVQVVVFLHLSLDCCKKQIVTIKLNEFVNCSLI